MYGDGIKISELIQRLEALKALHGDVPVIVAGGDYPEACTGARYNKTSQPYYPANTVVIG